MAEPRGELGAEAVLDTSVWIATFNGEPEADQLPKEQGDRRAVTTPIVLAELAARHALGKVRRGDPVADVEKASRYQELSRDDAIAAARTYAALRSKGKTKVSLADALIYATARRIAAVLITRDPDLEGQPGVVVLRG